MFIKDEVINVDENKFNGCKKDYEDGGYIGL